MFEVNGEYANRKGKYTVLTIDGPTMRVRYEDGIEAELKIHIQERIWENIRSEQEDLAAKSSARQRRRAAGSASNASHFIKVVSIPPGEELAFPGWDSRVVMVDTVDQSKQVKKGDRLIFYAQEEEKFFAVATVTSDPFEADPKKYTFVTDIETAEFCQIDIDADTGRLESGVDLDAIELESCPDFGAKTAKAESFCSISEDDFELLAEALTEITELEDEIDEDDDDFEEEEDE
jgi:hypothetical protein